MSDIPTAYMWSDSQFDIIKKYIQDFESLLNKDEEVGICLTQFGKSMLMQVEQITYEKSVVLVFIGKVDGKQSILIQHINQLNFLLTKIKKIDDKPRRPIGFGADID